MSKIVTTDLGRFRQVSDGQRKSFLFECPTCKEWLPMSEEHLNGSLAPVHLSRLDVVDMVTMNYGKICSYAKKEQYGTALVSTMQARILMDEAAHDTDHASLFLGE